MSSTLQRQKRQRKKTVEKLRSLGSLLTERKGVHTVGSVACRAETLDESMRTVDAVIATNSPVPVFDFIRGEIVDEVLVIDGCESRGKCSFLDNHYRWSNDDVWGSVRNIRKNGDKVVGTIHFADLGADDEVGRAIERAWKKVKDGHQDEVSAGYRALEATYIRAGEQQAINGRTYKADKRTLKVTTRWTLREVSLVPIGADINATMRWAIFDDERETMPNETTNQTPDDQQRAQGGQGGQATGNSAPPTPAPQPQNQPVPAIPPVSNEQIRAEAQRIERERISQIDETFREYAEFDGVQDLHRECINEGLSVEASAARLLARVTELRGDPVDHGSRRAPASHSRSHEGDCTRDAMTCAILLRQNVALDHHVFSDVQYRGARLPSVLQLAVDHEDRQRAMDNAWQYAQFSMMDIAREAIRLSGNEVPVGQDDIIERAFSSAEFGNLFTNSISAEVLVAYAEAEDSTHGWCREAEVPNFNTNERNSMGKMGPLKKLGPGGTAQHLSNDVTQETYKIARYAGQFQIDEQDLINDTMNAIEDMSPGDLGMAAAALRPDLVYAVLLSNGNLQDGTALFHADHNNLLTSSGLSESTIENAFEAMMAQRQNNRPLSLRPRYVIVPPPLYFLADRYCNSRNRDSSAGDDNPLRKKGLMVIGEERIGASGVFDPDTETAISGSASTWYTASANGEGGARNIEVGYRRGTGRAPRIRQTGLIQGKWGLNWDINLDIGAKALDYRGMTKATA